MPVIISSLDSGGGALNATSQTTNSKTPAAYKLYILTVKSRTGISVNPNIPTISGQGLTWVEVDSAVTDDAGVSRGRITLFRAMGSSPSTGSLTIDFGGQTQTHSGWIIDQFTGTDISGTNGSGAIVQEAQTNYPSSVYDSNLQASASVTLATFSAQINGTYGVYGNGNSTSTLTDGTGFTTVTDFTDTAGGSMEIRSMWDSANQTNVVMNTSPSDSEMAIFGIEIKTAATTFLEPGGDADFGTGLWTVVSGLPTIVTDFVHGGHIKSLKFQANAAALVKTAVGVLADSGSRLNWYVYIVALPTATATILSLTKSDGTTNTVTLRLTSGGVLQLWDGATAQIGTNGATLAVGKWYRISLAYTITSTTVNRFELFVGGISSISLTNAAISNIASSLGTWGNVSADTTLDQRLSDFYIDNHSTLTDPGNIWVTAKRPYANGTTNGYTTQIGTGGSGYGTGHAPQENERPNSDSNGWSMVGTGSAITEEYNIEPAVTGDINILSAMGVTDYALQFDGVQNYLSSGTISPSFSVSTISFGGKFVLLAGNTQLYGHLMNLGGADNACFYYNKSSNVITVKISSVLLDTTIITSPTIGTVYHIVATYDGTTCLIYINGTLTYTISKSGTLSFSSNLALVASQGGTNNLLAEIADDVFAYNGILTSSQVSNIYNSNIYPSSNMVFLWQMNEGTTRRNYVTNPSFEVDTTFWSAIVGSTITRITSDSQFGTASLQVDCTTSSASGARYYDSFSGQPTSLINRTFTASGYVKAKTSGDIGKAIGIHMIQIGTGAGNGEEYSTSFTLTANWQRIYLTSTFILATTSTNFLLDFREDNGTAVGFLLDGVQWEESNSLLSYFDGSMSSSNAVWEGTANASISQIGTTDSSGNGNTGTLVGNPLPIWTSLAATIVDYMGWLRTSALVSETGNIIVNGVSSTITIPPTTAFLTQIAGSTAYPAGTGADIGEITSTTLTTVSLYEAGVIVAYIPATAVKLGTSRLLMGMGT